MHGIFLYDETIHVPLLFKLPGELLAGRRVSSQVRLVDVAPTLLNMLNLPLPRTIQGESLVARMKSAQKQRDDLPAYAETDYPHRAFGWSALRSMRTGKYLFVRAPKRELYDQDRDAQAQHNLTAISPAVSDTLQAQLDEFRDKTASFHDKPGEGSKLDSEQSENLAALGYAGSAPAAMSPDPLVGDDPKDKIQVSNLLHQGMIAVEDGRYNEAIPMLQRVLSESPLISAAQVQLGVALARERRFSEAIPILQRAVQMLPDSTEAHYELGLALYESGAWRESAPYFEFVAKNRPKFPDAQYSLASVYARIQRIPEAIELLLGVLKQEPEHFRANLLLGRIYTLQQRADEALPYLSQAVASEPRNAEAHSFLADAYAQSGNVISAASERAKADALQHGTDSRPN
jgi:tetratricopeptide (TPR) repeat protein